MAEQPIETAPGASSGTGQRKSPSPKSASGSPRGTSAQSPGAVPAPAWMQPQDDDEEELFDDADSALGLGSEVASSTASLSASILEYRTLHGRTYHSMRGNADYWGPNDERANEAMDLTHHTLTLLLEDKLFLAPIAKDPQKVIDVGCGTGIWAIDFADAYPNCEVVGTDISPSQPGWVPPNLKFEIDDCTQPWTYGADMFDFIHMRYLFGSIADWDALYTEAYRTCKPGAWVQQLECTSTLFSDDGTIKPGTALDQWGPLFHEATRKSGRTMRVVEDGLVLPAMKKAGFVDVEERILKCPLTPWPSDPRQKEIGMYAKMAMEEGMDGFLLYLFTNSLGWPQEQCMVFVARMRRELRNKNISTYFKVQVVYGRKPEDAEPGS